MVRAAKSGSSTRHTVGSANRRLDIQGLRAIAVLVVVAFHAGLPVPGGFVGVDVFFVISGFVITAMLRREFHASGRIRFGRFYLNRFKRLIPALALMVTVTVILSTLLLSPMGAQQTTAATAVGAMLFVANFVIARSTGDYFGAPAEINPLLNTWSLSVEEQFYLAFPVMITLGWVLARRRTWLRLSPVLIVALIAGTSLGLAMMSASGVVFPGAGTLLGFYSPFTRAWEFAAGALLALASAKWAITSSRLAGTVGAVGLLLLASSLWLITGSTPFPGPWTLLPIVATLLLLAAGSNAANLTSQALALTPLVKVGDWSYSIYLWHWPMIVFAGVLWPAQPAVLMLAAVASIGPALASYYWVEQPIRALSGLTPSRVASLVTLTLLPPFAVVGGTEVVARMGWEPTGASQMRTAFSEAHAPTTGDCFSRGPFDRQYIDACTWNRDAVGKPIYLVGDSHAWHFSEAAIGAGAQLGSPVIVITTPSCPFVPGLKFAEFMSTDQTGLPVGDLTSFGFRHCEEYVASATSYLLQSPPGTVFIAAWDRYWWDPNIGITDEDGSPILDQQRKLASMETGLSSIIRSLEATGHKVVLVQSVPTYGLAETSWDPQFCTYSSAATNTCRQEVPLAYMDRIQGPTREALKRVALETGASVLDVRSYFCSSLTCSTHVDDRVQYKDASHLSVQASRELAGVFADAIIRER